MHLDAPVRRTTGFAAIAVVGNDYGGVESDGGRRSCDAGGCGTTGVDLECLGGASPILPVRPERVRATSPPLPSKNWASPLTVSVHVLLPPLPLSRPKDMASRLTFARLAPALTRARLAKPARISGARLARGYASQSEHTVRSHTAFRVQAE